MKISRQERALQAKRKVFKDSLHPKNLLSTGSTLLNLACTGKVQGGFPKGKYISIVGDSSAGKTWISLTCLAELCINPAFKSYRIIYDNGEDGALMDMRKFFGKNLVKRLEAPTKDKQGAPVYSDTVEDFYYHLDDAFAQSKEDERPFIYVLDSENSLTSKAEVSKFKKQKREYRVGKDSAGSFGDGKAKKHSEGLRRAVRPLGQTDSILIILSQTRDNINPMSFETKTRSGGKALKFYAHLEIWMSIQKNYTKIVRAKPRQVGVQAQVRIKKNRFTGKLRTVTVPIYHSHGIDDVGSCVDYLLTEGYWKKSGKITIIATDFEFKGTRDKLIKYIEEEGLEVDLQALVGDLWDEIEEASKIHRKKRYE